MNQEITEQDLENEEIEILRKRLDEIDLIPNDGNRENIIKKSELSRDLSRIMYEYSLKKVKLKISNLVQQKDKFEFD